MWVPVVLLGLATIGAYGTTQYAIGTLVPAIAADSGWKTGTLAGGYAIGVLAQGVVAILMGREFDRRGSRYVLLPTLAAGSTALLVASAAPSAWAFAIAWGVGGSAFGGGLYYGITIPAVVRLYPDRRAQALAVLTFIGALAAPIFSPMAALLIESFGWRVAIRGLVLASAVCVLPAALIVRAPAASPRPDEAVAGESWAQMLASPAVRRVLLVLALGGMANSALLLHQVSAMHAAGLTLAAASSFAGARGGFQLVGRALLAPLTRRFGTSGGMALCYGVAATSALSLLLVAATGGSFIVALYFAIVGGMSLGLLSPLAGLLQAEAYGDAWLGRLSGVGVFVVSLAGAAGAWGAGIAVEASGGFGISVSVIATLQVVAMVVALAHSRLRTRETSGTTRASGSHDALL